ncbi:MAG: toll/interleukin-1 receptor domain-containing protein [Ignavibacteriales bacterium]|nr:toll/interleukin-1 receptor domain-containing protein [Ignavibacteriales bacterium]
MYNIFISYAQNELRWAEYLKQHLALNNVDIFVAEHDLPAGSSLSIEISDQIKRSDLFVLLWTSNARESKYVNNELFLAKTEGKDILPVLLQPGAAFPPLLGDIKYLDIAKAPEAQLAWLRDFVQKRAQSKTLSDVIALGLLGLVAYVALKN